MEIKRALLIMLFLYCKLWTQKNQWSLIYQLYNSFPLLFLQFLAFYLQKYPFWLARMNLPPLRTKYIRYQIIIHLLVFRYLEIVYKLFLP